MLQNLNLSITIKQNEPKFLRLLKASNQAYTDAKILENTVSIMELLMGFAYPIIYLFIKNDSVKDAVFGFSLGISVLGELLIASYKANTEKGAIIREHFDTLLFGLSWKGTVSEVSEYEISKLAIKCKHDVTNYYPPQISSSIPNQQVIAICQMTNAVWDISLRKRYERDILIGIYIYTVILITLGVVVKADMLTTFLMFFSISSIYKYYIAILRGNSTVIKKRIKLLRQIEPFVIKNIFPTDTQLREFQDEIFQTRQETIKVPDFFAHLMKTHCLAEVEALIIEINKVYD